MSRHPRIPSRLVLPIVLLASACAAPTPDVLPPDPTPSPEALRERADALVGEEDYEASIPLYRALVRAWPDSIAVVYRLGQVLRATGRAEESLAQFDRARSEGYRVTSALYNTALARAAMDRMDAAFATLDTMMAAGFRNKYGLLTDPELDILRADPRWREFIGWVWGTVDHPRLSPPTGRFEIKHGVEIPMRDGTVLRATLMIPEGDGPFPTVLVRTPYGRPIEWGNRVHWASRGYALVAQDTRGRGDSDGTFDPWMNEAEDGFDTIAWIATQPWSDGRVGMIGASYAAQTQWLAAAAGPPGLVAMIPLVSGTDAFFDTPWDHGILKSGLLPWAYAVATGEDFKGDPDWRRAATGALADADRTALGMDLPAWNAWVSRDRPSSWERANFLERVASRLGARPSEPATTVLHVSGWWDVESIATQRNWMALQEAGAADQWLLYGPWEHQNFYEPPADHRGDLAFGEAAELPLIAEWTRFFDRALKRRSVGLDSVPRVRAFVIGANRWESGSRWPLEQTRLREFVLSTSDTGGARGGLSERGATRAPGRTYVFDPASIAIQEDPTFAQSTVYLPGARDATDQVAFVTEPLGSDMTLVGPVELEVSVVADATDVDLYAFLLDVAPDGEARALTHPGKMRASFAGGWERRRPLTPGVPTTVTVPMFPIGAVLSRGHRLGLAIRSDWYPRFAPPTPVGSQVPGRVRVTIGGLDGHRSVLRVWALPSDPEGP